MGGIQAEGKAETKSWQDEQLALLRSAGVCAGAAGWRMEGSRRGGPGVRRGPMVGHLVYQAQGLGLLPGGHGGQ